MKNTVFLKLTTTMLTVNTMKKLKSSDLSFITPPVRQVQELCHFSLCHTPSLPVLLSSSFGLSRFSFASFFLYFPLLPYFTTKSPCPLPQDIQIRFCQFPSPVQLYLPSQVVTTQSLSQLLPELCVTFFLLQLPLFNPCLHSLSLLDV